MEEKINLHEDRKAVPAQIKKSIPAKSRYINMRQSSSLCSLPKSQVGQRIDRLARESKTGQRG
jgi:hypothetical protein